MAKLLDPLPYITLAWGVRSGEPLVGMEHDTILKPRYGYNQDLSKYPFIDVTVPRVGQIWEEIIRPGHTIELLEVSDENVLYKHIGIYNKRAQGHPTRSLTKRFLRRYKMI